MDATAPLAHDPDTKLAVSLASIERPGDPSKEPVPPFWAMWCPPCPEQQARALINAVAPNTNPSAEVDSFRILESFPANRNGQGGGEGPWAERTEGRLPAPPRVTHFRNTPSQLIVFIRETQQPLDDPDEMKRLYTVRNRVHAVCAACSPALDSPARLTVVLVPPVDPQHPQSALALHPSATAAAAAAAAAAPTTNQARRLTPTAARRFFHLPKAEQARQMSVPVLAQEGESI